MARRSEHRGFASMDPERRRRIASEGGRSSHGGRSRDYEDQYEEDYDDYDEDENQGVSSRYENEDWDEGYEDEDEYEDTGYEGDDDRYDDEDNYDRRGTRSSGRRYSSGGRRGAGRGNRSRRGFASMDPNEQRRIARMGGEATARTHGRDFYEEIGHEGGRARWEEDEDDRRRGRSTSGSGRSSMGRSRAPSARSASSSGRRSTGSGRRGFGSMPREEVRRIARMGGRARWGEDYNDYDTGRRRRRGR